MCANVTRKFFSEIMVDQGLEQKIKTLKISGGVTGITQNESAMNRFLVAGPELNILSSNFQNKFTLTSSTFDNKYHHEVFGSASSYLITNANKVKTCIVQHCDGNPFSNDIKLMNIVTHMEVADKHKSDILLRDEKGTSKHLEFISEHLKPDSMTTRWDTIHKLSLKTFNSCLNARTVKINDKLFNVRDDRKFLTRLLVIMRSRSELSDQLPENIGKYEMSVTPKSLFKTQYKLRVPTDKGTFLQRIREFPHSDLTIMKRKTQ